MLEAGTRATQADLDLDPLCSQGIRRAEFDDDDIRAGNMPLLIGQVGWHMEFAARIQDHMSYLDIDASRTKLGDGRRLDHQFAISGFGI